MARCSRFIIFFFKEKFFVSAVVGESLAKFVEKIISPVIFDTNRSFKTVKYSFFSQTIVHQSFYGALFFFSGKVCVSLACVAAAKYPFCSVN